MKSITIYVGSPDYQNFRWAISSDPAYGVIDVCHEERVDGIWTVIPFGSMDFDVAEELAESIAIIAGIHKGTL